MLRAPGPDPDAVNELIQIAARVPDHRKLGPWRFIVFQGDARNTLSEKVVEVFKAKNPDASEKDIAIEAGRPLRAPVMVAVISSPDIAHKTPVWEQELSCGAVCYNLLLAANAAGWAGVWLTEWLAFDEDISNVLSLSADERVAGFIYLGTGIAQSPERPRPDIQSRISRFGDV